MDKYLKSPALNGIINTKFESSVRVELGRKRTSVSTSIFAVGFVGALAAAIYLYLPWFKIKRPEGGWIFHRKTPRGAHISHVNPAGPDEFTKLTHIAVEAEDNPKVYAFAMTGDLYGGDTRYHPLAPTGADLSFIHGIFLRDPTVPPGWICFPNYEVRGEGTRGLTKGDPFEMAKQADERSIRIFDMSGFVCKRLVLTALARARKDGKAVFIRYTTLA